MKKKKSKKIGTIAIGAALAVSCVLSPMAAAEETTTEAETSTTVVAQQSELDKAILNELLPNGLPEEETTTKSQEESTTQPAADVDKSILEAIIEDSEYTLSQIQPNWLTPESYQKFTNAIAEAKRVYDDPYATQADIDKVTETLYFQYDVDYFEFTREGVIELTKLMLSSIDESFSENQYYEFTYNSFKAYTEARAKLEKILNTSDASLEEIKLLSNEYLVSLEGLDFIQDLYTLRVESKKLLGRVKNTIADPEKYTKDSLAVVTDAVSALETGLDGENADFDELWEFYADLNEAQDNLVLASEEPTTEEPTTQEPTTKEPTTEETTTKKPTTKPSTDNPKTGDDRNLFPIGLAGSVSLAVMGAMVLLKKKKAGENE